VKSTVRDENRPSFRTYVAYTVVGIVLVASLVVTAIQGSSNTAVVLGGRLLGGVVSIGTVFLMVQPLIEKWFAAAELLDERRARVPEPP
jgi:hypothetical protein